MHGAGRVNVHIFNSTAQLVIPIGIPNNETKVEIQIHPMTVKLKIRKCLK